jgi:hypothetical protein
MTIEITRPEVQALIHQRLEAGGFATPEDVIFEALQEFHPKRAHSAGKRTLADTFSKIRGAAEDLDLTRDPAPGRDIAL